MGLQDLLGRGKHAKEISRACIGGYVFNKLPDEERKIVFTQIFRAICEYSPVHTTYDEARDDFNTSPAIVQAAFMVNAMIELGIHHGVRGFQWDYIPNPFALARYSEKAIMTAMENLREYGINPKECFS